MNHASDQILLSRERLKKLFIETPLPTDELLVNLGLYIRSQSLKRILFMNYLYEQIINIHGAVAEFGVRWGQNLSLFASFRDIYEPYNINREILGFDTFEGFPQINQKDGTSQLAMIGKYTVSQNYESYLTDLLDYHESETPTPHLRRFKIVKGDATITLEHFLTDNPQTIFAMVYFDFDIYEPTKKCLELIKNHITKGTVIGFDELNQKAFPGETVALREVLGIDKYSIKRTPFSGCSSYVVVE